MAFDISSVQSNIDAFLTDYLRNTTTDQEILDYYGEGNIVGRKGIPTSNKELLDAIDASHKLASLRPDTGRENLKLGLFTDNPVAYERTEIDIPGVLSRETGNPWQMGFEKLPLDFGSGSLTPAAIQFLEDFRVPKSAGYDFGFTTGPSVEDQRQKRLEWFFESDRGTRPANYQERLDKIKNQQISAGDETYTPEEWIRQGYITEKPSGDFSNKVLDLFKRKIAEVQSPFAGVSTLTPITDDGNTLRPGGDPNWRARLYEKAGLAGPISSQNFSTAYGTDSKDVQRFVTGNERLLPLQPYKEFYSDSFLSTPKSYVGVEPAPDFTPLQKAVGTRNYLIGRNILEGRGNLGKGVAGGLSIGAADLIPSREIVQDFYANKPVQGLTRMAGDIIGGIPAALATGAAVTAVPVLAPLAAGTGLALSGNRALGAIDEIVKQQTGEGILSKIRQTIGTAPRTGAVDKAPSINRPLVAQVQQLSPETKAELIRQQNRNVLQERIDEAKRVFNPRKLEFGLTELLGRKTKTARKY